MPFVKLDCGILNSTLWFERTAREIFITALLMAEPLETLEPMAEIATRTLDLTGWLVPPGWYGFVPAAGVGILHRAGIEKTDQSMNALESLASPEDASRSKEFLGRRMVRVNGGFIILNYMKYRERDYTAAERSKRYRERLAASHRSVTPSHRNITQAEGEAEAEGEKDPGSSVEQATKKQSEISLLSSADADFEAFRTAYPASRRVGGKAGRVAYTRARKSVEQALMLSAVASQKRSEQWQTPKLIPLMTTWLNQERWNQTLPEPKPYGQTLKTAGNVPALQKWASRPR